MTRVFAVATILLAVTGSAARGQGAAPYGAPKSWKAGKPAGIIAGIVLGPDDKPAPFAAITYQSSSGTAPHAVHADEHGRFTISKLNSDIYDLRASANGIFSEWKKNFRVQSGRTSDLTLRLIYAKE